MNQIEINKLIEETQKKSMIGESGYSEVELIHMEQEYLMSEQWQQDINNTYIYQENGFCDGFTKI